MWVCWKIWKLVIFNLKISPRKNIINSKLKTSLRIPWLVNSKEHSGGGELGLALALIVCIITFVHGFSGKEKKTRKMSNFDLPGWRGNLFTTDKFFLINILKICHNIRKCSKTNNILSLTDLYPPLHWVCQKNHKTLNPCSQMITKYLCDFSYYCQCIKSHPGPEAYLVEWLGSWGVIELMFKPQGNMRACNTKP